MLPTLSVSLLWACAAPTAHAASRSDTLVDCASHRARTPVYVSSVWTGAIKLSKFMITIFFMAHASGCVWMLIANMERTGDDLCVAAVTPVTAVTALA